MEKGNKKVKAAPVVVQTNFGGQMKDNEIDCERKLKEHFLHLLNENLM